MQSLLFESCPHLSALMIGTHAASELQLDPGIAAVGRSYSQHLQLLNPCVQHLAHQIAGESAESSQM